MNKSWVVLLICLHFLNGCVRKSDPEIARGIELFDQKHNKEAIEVLVSALERDSSNVVIHAYLQVAYNRENAYEQSILHGQQLISRDSQQVDAYHNLAYAYRRLGHHENAIRNLRKLLEFSAHDIKARGQLGILLASTGQYESAITQLESVLKLKDSDTFIRQTLALCHMHLGRYQEASDNLQYIIKTEPHSAQFAKVYLRLGNVFYLQGKWTEAIGTYQAISLDMDESTYQLAQHYIESLTTSTTEDRERKIIPGVPYPPRSYIARTMGACGSATLKMVLDFWRKGEPQYIIANQINENKQGALPFAMYDFAIQQGYQAYLCAINLETLKWILNQGFPVISFLLDPNMGWGHFTLVVGYDNAKKTIIAHDINNWIEEREFPVEQFLNNWRFYDYTALLVLPRNIHLGQDKLNQWYTQSCYHAFRGEYLLTDGDQQQGIAELKQAIATHPPLPGTYALLARIQNTKPLDIETSHGFALVRIGELFHLQGKLEQSLTVYKKGINLYPHSYDFRLNLSSLYLKRRDYNQAIPELEKAEKICRQVKQYCTNNARIMQDLAIAYLMVDSLNQAIEKYHQLFSRLSSSKEQIQVLQQIASLGIVTGQEDIAAEAIEKLISINADLPGWDTLLKAIQECGIEYVKVSLIKNKETGEITFQDYQLIQPCLE